MEAGFFPEEMPPPFVTDGLARFRKSIRKAHLGLPKVKGELWIHRYVSRPATYLFPRYGRSDRKHTLLNPINYFHLCAEISDNWVKVRQSFKKAPYSISPVVFDWDGERAFLKLNFSTKTDKTNSIMLESSFLINADIARYYHTIYTHSIAWAIHGKEVAKKNRSNSLLGNRLDLLVRNGQDGQTIGLPVGPDTSRVIAELLGAAIDRQLHLETDLPAARTIRFVDDLVAGVGSLEEGERVKAAFRRVVHQFELEINEEKTRTSSAHRMDYSSWRHIVKRAVPRPAASKEQYELFFDKVFEVADRNPGDNVLRYALKRAATNFLRASRWDLAEDFMLLAYRTNATVLSVVVDILVNRNATGADISKDKIKSFIEANLLRLCQNDKNGEVLWMFLAKALRIQLDMPVVRDLTRTFDPACALLLCDLSQRGLLTAPLDTGHWDLAANPDGLRSEMWLYAYEAPLKGWSGVSAKYLSSDPGFKPLAARGVSFYDVERNVPRLHRRIASDVASARKLAFALAENIEEVDLALLNAEPDYEEFFDEFDNGEVDDGY